MDMSKKHDQALQLQQALLVEYSKPDFQKKLAKLHSDECSEAEKTDLDLGLRELRQTLGAGFGFENSLEGVQESNQILSTYIFTDIEIMQNSNYLNLLLQPEIREELDAKLKSGTITKSEKALATNIRRRLELAEKSDIREKTEKAKKALVMKKLNKKSYVAETGRYWRVIGGEKNGGIVVRTNDEFQSLELPERLATGSIVEEMELNGERLHFQLVSGKGPALGWVSIGVKGATLLEPATTENL